MNTIFLGIIAFVLVVWFARSLNRGSQLKEVDKINIEEIPSYEEMVAMDDVKFKKWLFIFEKEIHREKLLKEMIDFEVKNNFINKEIEVKKGTPNEFTQLAYNLFDKNKNQEVFKFLKKLGEDKNKDFILEALLAKVATDRVRIR